jgi:iron complex outermembrane recepter protein
MSTGVYITHQYSFSEKWLLNSGLRFDYHHFRMDQSLNPDPGYGDPVFNPDFSRNYQGTALSAGINFLPGNNTVLKANLGKSYRVPSAYELGAYGLHRHEVRFEKGDMSNDPEQAWQMDLGFEKKWPGLEIMVSPFMNYFSNYLYLNPTAALRSEGQVYEYRQTKALMFGGEASLDYTLNNRIGLRAGAEYVYAVNLDLKMAIPFTPPSSILAEISYRFGSTLLPEKRRIGLEILRVAVQNYTAPNELSTPGYYTFGINARTDIYAGKQNISILLKVRNLLDNKYFNHLSFYRRLRIPEPGRDLQLFIAMPF